MPAWRGALRFATPVERLVRAISHAGLRSRRSDPRAPLYFGGPIAVAPPGVNEQKPRFKFLSLTGGVAMRGRGALSRRSPALHAPRIWSHTCG